MQYGGNDQCSSSCGSSLDNYTGTGTGPSPELPDSRRMEATDPLLDNERPTDELTVQIFRYKFTEDFNVELNNFAKIHQYDPRKVFKEAWLVWLEENDTLVSTEVNRLKTLGYEGEVVSKMFKSARYYYRKKVPVSKEPRERRSYVSVDKIFLQKMDDHIRNGLLRHNYKPSDGFDEFCNENVDLLKEEVKKLYKSGMKDPKDIKQKIKKTYKNRYFLFVQPYSVHFDK
jgi:hypothetical protein